MESKPKYQNGEVTLPIETYNQMLLKISLYERSLMIKRSWDGARVELHFSPAVVDLLVESTFDNNPLRHTYDLHPSSEWYGTQASIGELKPGYTLDDDRNVIPKPAINE